jgi:glycosyltransferase involved in cell wall biosynthesis
VRSLLVTKFLPAPPDSGGKLRSLAMLELLAGLGPVDLVAIDDGRADHDRLAGLGASIHAAAGTSSGADRMRGAVAMRSLSGARFWHPDVHATIRRLTSERSYDVVQVEYSPLAPYLRTADSAAVRVIDFHNVESALMATRARLARAPIGALLRAESRALERVEREAARTADVTVVVSDAEARRLGRPDNVVVAPNGWRPGPLLPAVEEPVVVFVGLLGWGPNRDAALWLAREIWPRVLRQVPTARLLIVGRDPTPDVRALSTASVEIVPSPADVRPYLARAALAVAPLRSGGGSRLKLLEALDAGRPVVATPLGADGFEPLVGRGVVLGTHADELADAVSALLGAPEQARALGCAAHELVRRDYSWERTLSELRERLDALLHRSARRAA